MYTEAGACVVALGILFALWHHLISFFLFFFSIAALLSAFDIVPADGIEIVFFLGTASLWVELAQVEKAMEVEQGTGEDGPNAPSALLIGAFIGLIGGIALWYGGVGPVVLPLLGAFGGAFFMALVGGLEPGRSLRLALLLVEREVSGMALKVGFCAALLLIVCEVMRS